MHTAHFKWRKPFKAKNTHRYFVFHPLLKMFKRLGLSQDFKNLKFSMYRQHLHVVC